MTLTTPYTYIQCSCSDQAPVEQSDSQSGGAGGDGTYDDDREFDPRAPRSNYSLYPLDYLLFCEDCQQIRCPRCVTEEMLAYFCPNCLFEVPSSNLRSEGTRCTRSCYQCPICTGTIQVAPTQKATDTATLNVDTQLANSGTFEFVCQYCAWTSSEIGIEFDRPSGIHSQLAKINNGGSPKITQKEAKERRKQNPDEPPIADALVDDDLQFANLKSFYQAQLAELAPTLGGMSMHESASFSSPAALSRIMSLYTGRGQQGKAQQGAPFAMREALGTEEGLKMVDLDESAAIKKLTSGGWDATASATQRELQLDSVRFVDDMRPVPFLLRTKRSKRCPACRHIVAKPESKISTTRFKIRLVAKSYIPTITVAPLRPAAPPVPVTSRPAVALEPPLTPLKPHQYIVTFKNPLFESVKVSLATPNMTPGRFASKVTVLCPQFEIGANTDMWDDALKDDGAQDKARKDDAGQAEAGKIWDRGRNWVSIVVEVVPSSLRVEHLGIGAAKDAVVDRSPLKEDEDVLEIPMFVRMEWEADVSNDLTASTRDRDTREKRELAYWCVLGVGRISKE